MKPFYTCAVSAFVLSVALVHPANAAEQSQPGMQQGTVPGVGSDAGSTLGWTTNKRAEDLDDMDVVSMSGDKIGEVEGIVRNKETNDTYAVVSVGGFLGIGDKDVVISTRDLSLRGDQLVAPQASKEELNARPEYAEDQYEELDEDMMVSIGEADAAAAGVASTQGTPGQGSIQPVRTFNNIDSDNNGYLSKSELDQRDSLSKHWGEMDQNNDDRIDASEFAAFETTEMTQGASQPGESSSTSGNSTAAPTAGSSNN